MAATCLLCRSLLLLCGGVVGFPGSSLASAHLGSTPKWNQVKRSSHGEVMAGTRRTDQKLPDLDRLALNGGFRPDQEEPSDEVTHSGNLTPRRSRESWNQAKSFSELDDMTDTSRWTLHLPVLEADGSEALQTYVWHPGEHRCYL